MGLSNDTLYGDLFEYERVVIGTPLSESDRLSTGEFSANVAKIAKGPSTNIDVQNAFNWKHGDKVYGTFAKSIGALKRYREDINKDWGQADKKKSIYIDTFQSIGPQLDKYKT